MNEKPKQVLLATKIIWISILLGLIVTAIRAYSIPSIPSEDAVRLFLSVTIVPLIMAVFAYLINKGKNWARITYSLYYCVSVVLLIKMIVSGQLIITPEILLSITIQGLATLAIILLFQSEPNTWFKQGAHDNPSFQV